VSAPRGPEGPTAAPAGPAGALAAWIDDSPTPWHAAEGAADRLVAAGFERLAPHGAWSSVPERAVVVRDGSLVAWSGRPGATPRPLRMIGAHTDSPGLRVRPRPDTGRAGFAQLSVEVYGGALLNSWLDRDLTLAGRVAVRDPRAPGGSTLRPFHHRDPLLRVPQLAIHLDRQVNDAGLRLDRQSHLTPVWALGEPREGDFAAWLAGEVGVAPGDVLAWDVACVDTLPPAALGRQGEMLAAPRLDNLCSCFGAVEALAAAPADGLPSVVVLHDHEEVGSTTATGAVGSWLAQVLERVALAGGGDRATLLTALAGSLLLSADMAHGTHPNYPERHEPGHWVTPGAGPVLKHNVNANYASDARGTAAFALACEAAGVPMQRYSHRGDIPCGSTIGPLTAAGLAVDTVDVGMAQLSMHAARELMACADVAHMLAAFGAWLEPQPESSDARPAGI
jgi:aspartyl aminopeptidase